MSELRMIRRDEGYESCSNTGYGVGQQIKKYKGLYRILLCKLYVDFAALKHYIFKCLLHL